MTDISGNCVEMLKALSQPAFKIERNGRVIFANESMIKLLGLDESSLIGKNISEIFPEEWTGDFYAGVEKALASGAIHKFTLTATFADKKLRTENIILPISGNSENEEVLVIISVLPLTGDEGSPHCGSSVRPDGKSNFPLEQTKFILSATKTNLDIIDPEFNIRFVDDEWLKLYGPFAGKKCYQYFMGSNEPCEGCGLVKAFETKLPVVTEEILKKEGNRVVQVTTFPFQAETGEWLLAEVNVDISERKKMEEEVKRTNIFLDSLIENIPDMLFLKDARELRFLRFNRAGEELLGYSREELIGKNDYDIFPKEQADFFVEKDREAVSGNVPVDIVQEKINTRNKGSRILHTKKVPIKDENGQAVFLLGISEDVTERIKAEEEIHKQWGLLSNLIDNIPFYVFWKDRASVYVGCNKAFAEGSGIGDPVNIAGKSDYDLPWKKEESDFFRKIDNEVMEKGIPIMNLEEKQFQAGGREAVVLTSKVPLRDVAGNITGILGIYADITERKDTEKKLKLFRDLMNQSSDSLFLVDAETGRFLDVNDQASVSLGYTRDELLRMSVPDVEALISGREDLIKEFEELKTKGSSVFRGEHIKKNGENFPVEVSQKYVELEKIPYVVAVVRDISERMKLEEQLKSSEKKYRTIFENTGAITAIIDGDMNISMVNSEFERFFGFNPEITKEKRRIDTFVHGDDVERVRNYHRLRRIDPGSIPSNYEIKMYDKCGRERATYLTVALIPGTENSVLSFLDLTELKEKEFELKKQRDLLDSTNKVLEHKIAELNDALGHIKRLEGLVPICSSCKKIMKEGSDPKKSDSWVNIEKYISDRTEASFTHGLCPDCIGKLYGDYVGKKKKKDSN